MCNRARSTHNGDIGEGLLGENVQQSLWIYSDHCAASFHCCAQTTAVAAEARRETKHVL